MDFTEWTVPKRRSSGKVIQELVSSIEVLINLSKKALIGELNAYPKLFVSVPRRKDLRIYFNGVIWERNIGLQIIQSDFADKGSITAVPTLIFGGTEGALSSGVGFELAEMGRMRLAFFAAGCEGEEAKNVAVTVAE